MRNYNIENGVLIQYNGNAAQPSIPNGVTEIECGAFDGCDTITSINIPSSVTKIDNNAFRFCKNLKSVEIPNSVTYIGGLAFYGCLSLKNVTIPSSVTNIDFSAFKGIKKVQPQYNSNGTLRAFKTFFHDWTCRGYQYKVGESYHQDGTIICCCNGFHACPNPMDVFNYYHGNLNDLHFAEVELSGEMDWGYSNDKTAASDIRIIRELSVQELCEIYNNMEKE